MESHDSRNAVNLTDLAAVLRRRLPVLLAAVAITALAAYAFSSSQTPKYEAAASVLTTDQGFIQTAVGAATPSTDHVRQGHTNLELARRPAIADRAAGRLTDLRLSGGEVRKRTQVTAAELSDVLTFVASDSDPDRSARIANTYAAAYVATERSAKARQIRLAREDLEQQLDDLGSESSARANDLRRAVADKLSTLGTLSALRTSAPRVVQEAGVPSSPISPKPRRNALIGAGLGLFLGLGLIALIEQLSPRIRSVNQLEDIYGVPLLGTVPHLPARARLGKAGSVPDPERLPRDAVEAFRRIRANLSYFNVGRQIRSIVVVSALADEGKSTVAWHLATADPAEPAVLIDADLREPTVSSAFNGAAPAVGLSDYLAVDDLSLAPHRRPDSSAVGLIPAGQRPSNPTTLLQAPRMRSIVEELAEQNQLAIIDTPALGLVADALPLLSYSSGVIIVARLGTSRKEAAKRLRDLLTTAGAPVLGLVANDVPNAAGQY